MSDNTHGGSRPKIRPDDARGGAGRGQGRKKSTHKIKIGQSPIVEVSQGGKSLLPPLPFDIVSMDNGFILLWCGDYEISIHF